MAHNLIGIDIGRYHIVEQLGLGGMAVVYKAFDTRLEREVAIKVIRRDAFPPDILEQALKRFEREAKTLARMNHPNIVAVHDYGEFEGSPYLVMAYISGGTLRDRLHENGVPYSQAVRLLLPVARALDYAHSLNVVHRDVKPVNILMTASGEPMLSDFGIAKILENTGQYTLTGTHVGIGTPEYMSPEQGMGRTVDHRTDIYALGVVLFELVTGRRPYVADTPMAVVFMHLSDPLPRPRDLVPTLPEAVEQIIFKAMAKRPEDRYQNTAEMAAALEVLAGAAVDHQDIHFHNEEALTHPPTSSLPGKTAPGKIEHTPAPAAPTPAASRTPAQAPAPLPEQDKQAAPPAPTGRDLAENTPPPPAAGAATVVDNPPAAAEKHLPPAMMTIHDAVQLADTEPVSQSGSPLPEKITTEWPTQVQPKKQPGKNRLAFSGWKRAALIAAAMLLIGLAAAGAKRLFAPPAQLPAMSVLGTKNTASINQTRRIKVDRVNQLTYSPGGVWIAAATPSGIDLIDAKTLVRVRHIDAGGTVLCAAFAPDGQTLSAGLENGLVTIWLVANGSSLRTLKAHTNGVYSVTYSPDGSILATGSADTTIQLWNVNAEYTAQPLTGHTAGVQSLAFAPDGKILASGSADNTIRLWRAADGALIHEISHPSPVRSVAFSPDGLILASASDDTIVTLSFPDGTLRTMQGHSGMVNSLAFSPDGQMLVSGSADNTLRLWQVPDGSPLRTLEDSPNPVNSVDFAPDGKALASGSSDGAIRLWGIPNQ
jgi:serine/threonine protein kinase